MEQTTASTTRPSSNHGGGYSLDNLTTSTPRRGSVDKERPPSDTIVVNHPPPTAGSRNSNSSNKKASSSSNNAQYCYRQPISQFRSTPTTSTVKQHAPPTTTRTTTTTREEEPRPSPYQNMEYESAEEFTNALRGRQRNNKNKQEEPSVASTKTRSTSSSSTEFFQYDNIIEEEEDEVDEEVPSSASTRRRRKRSKSKPTTRKKKSRRGRRKDRNRDTDNTDEENPYSTDHRPMTAVPEEGDSCIEELDEETKTLFRRAADFIQPSSLFRLIVHLYGERKLVVFFWLHFVATMAIWVHFGLIKWDEQRATVPDGAPNYWWKRIAPPLEFGSMHAILFQMALLPLTMSRFSIAALSDSLVDRFIPMNRMLRIHIHLGYTMVGIVFLAVVFFFLFFGLLCSRGEEAFCDKFTSEIMITGYLILGFLLLIGGTSYVRHKIPYEVFYVIHHAVFLLYLVTILHTLDKVERDDGRKRSQTFKWFSSTLLYYACDRIAMHLNHRYRAKVLSSVAVEGADSSRMLLVKLRRPALFQFKPGQYAFLKVPAIDHHWHPFSIASGPSSRNLEFYIEVFGPATWTGQLWTLLGGDDVDGLNPSEQVDMEVMGPYGTSLGASTGDYSHALAIGAGTGIVPVSAMFQEHVRNVLRLSPDVHFRIVEEARKHRAEYEFAEEERKGSVAKKIASQCCGPSHQRRGGLDDQAFGQTRKDSRRHTIMSTLTEVSNEALQSVSDSSFNAAIPSRSTNDLKRAAFQATKSIYGVVFMGFLTVYAATVLSLSLSWNTIPIDLYKGMTGFLQVVTWIFEILFAWTAVCVWDGNQFLAYIDIVLCIVCIPANVSWYNEYDRNNRLGATSTTLLALLLGYMTARLWVKAVGRRHTSWRHGSGESCAGTLERMEIVWVARSAPLVAKILPDIDQLWNEVVKKWGLKDALHVCRVSVYCTDKNRFAVGALRSEISKTSLYKHGFVHFARPDFEEVIQNHTLELIDLSNSRSSSSLLAFCGSPILARTLHRFKLSNDMMKAIVGHKEHQMDFVSESYCGVRSSSAKGSTTTIHNLDFLNADKAKLKPKGAYSVGQSSRRVITYDRR